MPIALSFTARYFNALQIRNSSLNGKARFFNIYNGMMKTVHALCSKIGVFALSLVEEMFCLATLKYMSVLLSRYFALALVSQDHQLVYIR